MGVQRHWAIVLVLNTMFFLRPLLSEMVSCVYRLGGYSGVLNKDPLFNSVYGHSMQVWGLKRLDECQILICSTLYRVQNVQNVT